VGENTIRIKATNQVSSAEDMVIIALDNPNQTTIAAPVVVVTPPAAYREETVLPMVRFLQPATPVEVSENFFRLRAETQNVGRKNDIDLFVNDAEVHNFAFGENGIVSVSLFLAEGYNTMEIIATNEAGYASEWTSIVYRKPVYNTPVYQQPAYRPPVSQPVYQEPVAQQPAYRPPVTEEPVTQQPVNRPPASDEPVDAPCRMPVISLIEPGQNQGSTDQQNCTFRAEVSNVHGNQLRLSSNGKPMTFNLNNNILSSSVPLVSGPNTILLSATNACGEEKVSASINYVPPVVETPCTSPKLTFTLQEVQRNDATHELRGSVSGVKNKADISLTLDDLAYNGFQYEPSTGNLSAKFKLVPGSHTVVITVSNECGTDTKSETVILEEEEEEEEACGIRINPGNADWQFCLVTPSGTYNRSSLSNSNFSYSGSASSLFIQPIAGGGNAIVNGNPYLLRSGQYYLFTGGLNVQVSTKNPGSMGHWSVCITASSAPISGNGNNRPKSPCESVNDDKSKGNQDDKSKGNQDDKSKGNQENQSQGNQDNRSRGNENDSSTRQNNNRANVKSAESPKANEDEKTNRNAGNNTQRTVRRR
jgi:hypothetical protein